MNAESGERNAEIGMRRSLPACELPEALRPTPHPLFALPSEAELAALFARPDGATLYAEWFNRRERAIQLAAADPYRYEPPLGWYADADGLLGEPGVRLLILLGGNRAGKSTYAARRVIETLAERRDSEAWCFHETVESSVRDQQGIVWKHLPAEWRAARKGQVTNLSYTKKNGFSENKFVAPNGAVCLFKHYSQDPDTIEGGEIDAAWCDELAPLEVIRTLRYRLATRNGILLVTFTPKRGYSATVKEFVEGATTLQWRPARLLAAQINVPGGPAGQMPYIQAPAVERQARVMYVHSDLNPTGGWENLAQMLEGKPDAEVKIRFYGWATKVSGTAFPNFGEVNLVAPEHVPTEGTNYRLCDPAGARNWFLIWWRVAPDGRHYIYREWPDWDTYGPWAEASSRGEKPEGDIGPGQATVGYGVGEYKALIRRLERKAEGRGQRTEDRGHRAEDAEAEYEEIFESYIDPRAGKSQHAAEVGGTCLIDQMIETQTKDGVELGPMVWLPASGISIEEGEQAINDLLAWDDSRPFDALLNSPNLYVSRECRNVIWALQHWTGRGGEKAACKDPVDLVRYGAVQRLMHVPGGRLQCSQGGAY